MPLFFTWMGITALILTIYIMVIWIRNRYTSRFSAKLTILFLLFVMIPSVPLTFFISHLMTQSADILLLPGIGQALEMSLETIRLQTEEKGKCFLNSYPNANTWVKSALDNHLIPVAGSFQLQNKKIHPLVQLKTIMTSESSEWMPSQEMLQNAWINKKTSTMTTFREETILTVFHYKPDSLIHMVSYPIPQHILHAKTEIESALSIYNTLSLLKESIIEKNLIWAISVLIVIALAILSISTAKKLSRGISEPINDMVKGMRQISEGDLDHKVHTQAKGEFQFLVNTFNQMVEDLKVTRQQLIKAERLAAWREVARRISHEIKNSLTPIAVSLHRIQDYASQHNLPSQIEESMKAVEEELQGLRQMAAEFSEFARLPQPQMEKIDINEVIQSVVQLKKPVLNHIQFVLNLKNSLPKIKADRQQIKQVVHNLIQNGIEASEQTGSLMIHTRESSNSFYTIEFRIQDHGKGMDAETTEKMFQPYFTTKLKGTGLGLAIVKKIIEDHNGEIVVESNKEKGTTIIIRLS